MIKSFDICSKVFTLVAMLKILYNLLITERNIGIGGFIILNILDKKIRTKLF